MEAAKPVHPPALVEPAVLMMVAEELVKPDIVVGMIPVNLELANRIVQHLI